MRLGENVVLARGKRTEGRIAVQPNDGLVPEQRRYSVTRIGLGAVALAACFSSFVCLVSLGGCKREIDMTSVDAGSATAAVTADPAASAATESAPVAAAPAASGAAAEGDAPLAPLAPLQGEGKASQGEAKKPTTGGSTAKPKPSASAATGGSGATGGQKEPEPPPQTGSQPAECAQAARFCSHPAYATDPAIKNLCETKKAECARKGGHP